jgi:hypothetical protein
MYKKISHTITEEHFHHPVALEMSAVLAHHANAAPHHMTLAASHAITHGNVTPYHSPVKTKLSNVFAPNTNTNSAVMFRQNIRDYFTNLIGDLRRYAEAVFANSTTLADQRAYILSQANALAGIIDHGALNASGVTTVNTIMTNLVTAMMNYADAIKAGTDATGIRNQIIAATQSLGQFIGSSNPVIWPGTSLSDVWVPAASGWQDLVTAVSQKNFAAEQAASTAMTQALATGQPTGVLSFADAVSQGIIQQFPGAFAS